MCANQASPSSCSLSHAPSIHALSGDLDTDINNYIIPIDVIAWLTMPALVLLAVRSFGKPWLLYVMISITVAITIIVLVAVFKTPNFQYADLPELNPD